MDIIIQSIKKSGKGNFKVDLKLQLLNRADSVDQDQTAHLVQSDHELH